MLLSDLQTIVGVPKRYQRCRINDFYTDRYRKNIDNLLEVLDDGLIDFVFIWGDNASVTSSIACAVLAMWLKSHTSLGYYTTIETLVTYKDVTDETDLKYGSYEKFCGAEFLVLDHICKSAVSNKAQLYFATILEEFLTNRSNNALPSIITSKYPLFGAKNSVASLLSQRLAEIIKNGSALEFEMK